VESAGAAVEVLAGADDVGVAGVLVDPDVVGASEPAVVSRLGQLDRCLASLDRAELGEVEDLHAVLACLGDDECVVVIHLDVAPDHVLCARGRQVAEVDRATLGS
jgi:hypothetical protein